MNKPLPASIAITPTETDDERRYFAGWCSVVAVDGEPITDDEGDIIGEDTLEDAVNGFALGPRGGLIRHRGEVVLRITQSVFAGTDLQKAWGISLDFTGWWVAGFAETDEAWRLIKSGEMRGLSVGGHGVREPITKGRGHAMFLEVLQRQRRV